MANERNVHAAEVLRKLDEMGAIKLDVLASKASEIIGAVGSVPDDDGTYRICYPFYIHIGPRADLDLVAVAAQVKQLGFELKRAAVVSTKG